MEKQEEYKLTFTFTDADGYETVYNIFFPSLEHYEDCKGKIEQGIEDAELDSTLKKLVIITASEYDWLTKDADMLQFLHFRGVDNWDGYAKPPNPNDYDTPEEYNKAYALAVNTFN